MEDGDEDVGARVKGRGKLISLGITALAVAALPVGVAPGEAATTPAPRNGEAAIKALGGKLTTAARAAGVSTTEFADRLRADPTLHVDATGRVLAVDTHLGDHADEDAAAEASAAAEDADPQAADIPYDQTFRLHSRPGAQRVVFIDFDGHTVSGTAWNRNYTGNAAFAAEPYDTDGVPGTFSEDELDVVQRVWQRVSEDFAPFDIDVTTEEPSAAAIERSSSTDQTFGTRVLVTNTGAIHSTCRCGGLAYVGVYGLTSNHGYYQPAFVFTRGAGTGDKAVAEAVSHEVGHTIGLYHDGSATTGYYAGHGNWAPIMGVGYYRPVTQWSRGEYTGANQRQDDLTIIQTNGAPLRADDHGDSFAAATLLTGPDLEATGRIATGSDKDVFRFEAGAGGATLNVAPAPYGPNADLRLELIDEAGDVLANADPVSGMSSGDLAYGLDAGVTVTLTPGTYFARISSVGAGNPLSTGYSSYGSVGTYTLSGTVGQADTSNTPPVAVANATPTGVVPGQAVAFSSAGSLDPDGTVAGYRWDFGDGTASTMANPSKAYTAPGSYTARLTVTDSLGAADEATVTVDVLPPSSRIQSIRMSLVVRSGRVTGQALVTVTDSIGRPVKGATVRANWTGTTQSPASGTTGAAGTVLLKSPATTARTPTFTVTIADVTAAGKPYDARLNLVASATVRR